MRGSDSYVRHMIYCRERELKLDSDCSRDSGRDIVVGTERGQGHGRSQRGNDIKVGTQRDRAR